MLRSQGIGIDIPARGKFILVNIPSFELIALQDGELVLRSRVVVGKSTSTTPMKRHYSIDRSGAESRMRSRGEGAFAGCVVAWRV